MGTTLAWLYGVLAIASVFITAGMGKLWVERRMERDRPDPDVYLAVIGYAALGVIVTVFLQAAFDLILAPIELPSFTAAYVLTMYLFIAPRKFAPPHPHKPVVDHALNPAAHAPADPTPETRATAATNPS